MSRFSSRQTLAFVEFCQSSTYWADALVMMIMIKIITIVIIIMNINSNFRHVCEKKEAIFCLLVTE